MMIKAFCYFCFFLFGVLPLTAQVDSGGIKPRKPGRVAWFACTSLPKGFENPCKVMTDKSVAELEIPRYMASDPVKIPKDGIIRIVREVPDPDEPEKIKYLVLAEAKIPGNVRQALIVLIPLPEPRGDLLFTAMVQDLARFKGGDRMFINLSNTDIRVKLGSTKVLVAPKKVNIYQATKLTKPTNVPIMYEFYHPDHKKWRLLTASTVVLRPTRREINIFNEGTRIGNIRKHKVLFPLPIKKTVMD
ncbi:MAG TPA: hypothetical protein DHW77_03640 [Verrucomicrobiales bacterium]|nr:hypothetical protein [Verrucomicrobiales bacterium]